MSQLMLQFLGPFQVLMNNQPVVAFQSNKARALLAYLAVESPQPQPRTTLAGLFWPEYPEKYARDNLRHALTNLRKVLQNEQAVPPFLLTDSQTVQFNPQSRHQLDVADFTQALINHDKPTTIPGRDSITALEQAVACYRGPFLQGFFLDDCSAFEEWLLLTRERLHNQMLTTLATLAAYFEGLQEFDKAESYARRLVALDNLQEEAHYRLMRILACRGQRSAALQQYEQCRQVLAAEFGAPPSAEMVALHQQIQRGRWDTNLSQPITRPSLPLPIHPFTPHLPLQHNLPVPLNSFVGRTREVADICVFLRQPTVRLLTLHGTAGVGKTRLALQVARQLLDDFPDGCIWVELVSLQVVAQVPIAIAQSLNVAESAGDDPLQHLKNYLRNKALLLVLDNYEHLLDAASLVTELLSSAEHLKCLVTSRTPLHLYGEQEYLVEPLPLPAADVALTPAQLVQMDAVQLFQQRALNVHPQFLCDESMVPIVAEICTRLDGIPLAIELAAARTRQLTAQTLLARLKEDGILAPNLLDSRTRNAIDRHRTLEAAIAWSYALLEPDEQRLFRRLAIFSGACTLEAIAALCVQEMLPVADLVWRLVDKNLVRAIAPPVGKRSHNAMPQRFELLATTRAFGLTKLREEQELAPMQKALTLYYLTLVEQIDPTLHTEQGPYGCDYLESELPNLLAVLQYTANEPAIEWGLRLCNALWKFWLEHGYLVTGQRYLFQMLEAAHALPATPAYAMSLFTAGIILTKQGNYRQARTFCEESHRLNRSFGNEDQANRSLDLLAVSTFVLGDYETCDRITAELLAIYQATKQDWHLGWTLARMGKRAARRGCFAEARALLNEGLAISQQAKHGYGVGLSLHWMTMVARREGKLAEARDLLEKAMDLSNKAGYRDPALHNEAACIALAEGHFDVARHHLRSAHQLSRELGYRNMLLEIGDTLVHFFVAQGDFSRVLIAAATLLRLNQEMAAVMPAWEQGKFNAAIEIARTALGAEGAARAWAIGEQIPLANIDEQWMKMLDVLSAPTPG